MVINNHHHTTQRTPKDLRLHSRALLARVSRAPRRLRATLRAERGQIPDSSVQMKKNRTSRASRLRILARDDGASARNIIYHERGEWYVTTSIYGTSLGPWTNAPGRYDCPSPAMRSAKAMVFLAPASCAPVPVDDVGPSELVPFEAAPTSTSGAIVVVGGGWTVAAGAGAAGGSSARCSRLNDAGRNEANRSSAAEGAAGAAGAEGAEDAVGSVPTEGAALAPAAALASAAAGVPPVASPARAALRAASNNSSSVTVCAFAATSRSPAPPFISRAPPLRESTSAPAPAPPTPPTPTASIFTRATPSSAGLAPAPLASERFAPRSDASLVGAGTFASRDAPAAAGSPRDDLDGAFVLALFAAASFMAAADATRDGASLRRFVARAAEAEVEVVVGRGIRGEGEGAFALGAFALALDATSAGVVEGDGAWCWFRDPGASASAAAASVSVTWTRCGSGAASVLARHRRSAAECLQLPLGCAGRGASPGARACTKVDPGLVAAGHVHDASTASTPTRTRTS